MAWLSKFRLVELTTNSDKKRYKPQVLLYTNNVTTGMLWWKETKVVEDWCSFYAEPDNTFMFRYFDLSRAELIFDSIEEAKNAIEKFKVDMKALYERSDDNTYKNQTKIIDVN
jgi:hypothetical protein